MKRTITWMSLLILALVYVVIVSVFPFEGPVALVLHFSRLAVVVAAFVMMIPMAPTLFKELPPPRIDRLFASVIFMLLSAEYFSVLNEIGRVFGVDTSIFTSPFAGFGSLLLTVGAGWALSLSLDPDLPKEGKEKSEKVLILAIVVGIFVSVGIVFIAPLFR